MTKYRWVPAEAEEDDQESSLCCLCCKTKSVWMDLRNMNIAAAVFHALFAIVILWFGISGQMPYAVPLTTSLPTVSDSFVALFDNNECGGKLYRGNKYDGESVFDWFECQRKTGLTPNRSATLASFEQLDGANGDPDMFVPPFQTTYYTTTEIKTWTLIFAFCVITSVFHMINVIFQDSYNSLLRQSKQPLRWLEYSITASIMFVIVASITRLTDLYFVITIFLLTMCQNMVGGLIEYISPQHVLIRLWGWIISLLTFVFQFWALFDVLRQTLSPFVTAEKTGHLWQEIFEFVYIANYGILVSFSLFPLVSVLQNIYYTFMKQQIWWNAFYEMCYILLSFVSKGFLVIIMSLASAQRGGPPQE